MTHGELFAGISGFGVGFARSGIETVWRVENDPHCQRLLRSHYPDTLLLGDVKDCGAHNLPPVDIISFGSPCQDLSVAGKRGGFAGERSGLFFEAIRIIRELRPTIAVWENVGGAQSSYRGRDFAVAIQALAESGAVDIGWAVLDARWFGVAQQRRRVFVVADFGGRRAGQVLAIPSGLRGDTPPSREAGEDVAGTLTVGANQYSGFPGEPVEVSYALNAKQGNRYDGESETFVFDWQSGGDVRHNVSTEHSSALQASQTPAVFQARIARIRRLTPTEYERLMGHADGYTAGFSDAVRYRMLGNGVVVNVAEWIAQRIVEALCSEYAWPQWAYGSNDPERTERRPGPTARGRRTADTGLRA